MVIFWDFQTWGWESGPPSPNLDPHLSKQEVSKEWLETQMSRILNSQFLQMSVALQQTDTKANVFLRSPPFISTRGWLLVYKPGNLKAFWKYFALLPPKFCSCFVSNMGFTLLFLDFHKEQDKIRQHSCRKHTAHLETASISVSVATIRCHTWGSGRLTNEQVWKGLQWSPPDVTGRGGGKSPGLTRPDVRRGEGAGVGPQV